MCTLNDNIKDLILQTYSFDVLIDDCRHVIRSLGLITKND